MFSRPATLLRLNSADHSTLTWKSKRHNPFLLRRKNDWNLKHWKKQLQFHSSELLFQYFISILTLVCARVCECVWEREKQSSWKFVVNLNAEGYSNLVWKAFLIGRHGFTIFPDRWNLEFEFVNLSWYVYDRHMVHLFTRIIWKWFLQTVSVDDFSDGSV